MDPSSRDLATDLLFAAGRGQIAPRYQPVVAPASGAVVGLVVRPEWAHPELGPLPGDQFLPVADRLGLRADLDRWTLETACAELARWGGEAVDALSVVLVPCAAATLRAPGFADGARASADLSGLPADRLAVGWPDASPPAAVRRDLAGLGLGLAVIAGDPAGDRLDAGVVVLTPAATDALYASPDAQRAVRAASRRGVKVVARPAGTLGALTAPEGVFALVGGLQAVAASQVRAALSGRVSA